ncbi:tetratricopeptide repeat protein, partial [uncultured Cardiobacterium sp.]|uniref:tetratricopeptide repeat protein n=1 Tax=uncultured Cardiobacterium sp. TaxID=417619 RepID=UPI0026072E24
MKTTLCLALLLATTAAHALSDSEKETLMTAAVEAYERQDYATALEKWRTLAEAGDAAAQNNLGVLYAEGQGVAQDYAQARTWFEKAAAQGHANAQNSLGFLYAKGQGVAQDYAQAHAWWEKAAAQGHAEAQFNLGTLYDK